MNTPPIPPGSPNTGNPNAALADTAPATPGITADRYEAAYELVRPQREALKPDQLVPISIDVIAASLILFGRYEEISSYREQVERDLPNFDSAVFGHVLDYALASSHAHTRFAAASSNTALAELYDRVARIRDVLVADVTALGKRKLVDASRLSELRGPPGHKNVAYDVLLLRTILRDHWAQVASRTGVTPAELAEAAELADQLANAVAIREQQANMVTEASDQRQRAFTLYVNAYDQVRRAISFLRWDEGDVDRIAPSLYAGRGGPKRKVDTQEDPAVTDPATPAAPGTPGAVGAAPAGSPATAPTNGAHGTATDGAPNGAPPGTPGPGMPGHNPF